MNCVLKMLEAMGSAPAWSQQSLNGKRNAVRAALQFRDDAIDGRTLTDLLGGAEPAMILIFPAKDDPAPVPEPAPPPEPDATPPREDISGGLG